MTGKLVGIVLVTAGLIAAVNEVVMRTFDLAWMGIGVVLLVVGYLLMKRRPTSSRE